MDIERCQRCESRCGDECGPEDMKIEDMTRCPLHDPDIIEELNDPKYQAHLDELLIT